MSSVKLSIILFVILAFAAYGNDLSGFFIEPYLLDVTPNTATVAFHLSEPMSAKVRVFDDGLIHEFESSAKSKSHFIKVTGLDEASVYKYEVVCGGGQIQTAKGDDSFQIKTACRSGKSFTFAVYGDPRPGETQIGLHHREIIEQVIVHEPVFSLVLGDMVDDGANAKLWKDFFQIESDLLRRSAIYTVMGDNDYAGGLGLYSKYFPKLERGYYRFEWGGVQFLGLRAWDTRGQQPRGEINAESEQVRWLESELSKKHVQNAPFRVVFLHDPVYISRGNSSQVLRRVLTPIFRKYNVDVVFASWHLYERSINESVTYIISGGGGAELIWMKKDQGYASQSEARRHHFCRVDVDSETMTIRAIAKDGTILDTVTLTPKSREPDTAMPMERMARRVQKEIVINSKNNNPELGLYLFSHDCSYCRKLLKHDLPRLARKNNIALRVFYYDFGDEGVYDIFLNMGAEFGRQGADIPAIFVGRSVLGGESEIKSQIGKEISDFQQNPPQYLEQMVVPFTQSHDTATLAEQKFDALTFGIVAGAGLLDGINPCAFTTIIFLISYLSLAGVSRKQMFYTGGVFTLAVFLTYLIIGLAFFNFLKLILRNQAAVMIVNSLLLLILVTLAIFSIVDFFRCLKGNVKDVSLQLPDFLKNRIRTRVRDFARNKAAIVGSSFVLGVVIAGMELACTGQVYIPVVTMISEPAHRIIAVLYLFLYNTAFILPLVAVFLLAAFGVTSERMGNLFRRHLATVKMGFVILFSAMAVITIYNLGWL